MFNHSLRLPKYSIGVGDRFSLQGAAQLQACVNALQQGVEVIPVWNKSGREHNMIGSEPSQTRQGAQTAVEINKWTHPYFVDADHIDLETVDRFIEPCDFFTIDVAGKIGVPAHQDSVNEFTNRHPELLDEIPLNGLDSILKANREQIDNIARKYLTPVSEAGKIYQYIEERKGSGQFITEISMDETDLPQKPIELMVILVAVADEKIPIQTIAPKFTGRFNKGVDFRGNIEAFTQEFSADLAVVAHAIREYGLPDNLKLSMHSGSDKFSLYPHIHDAIKSAGAGLHLKTAGTTWLEEVTGLARAGGRGLNIAKEIYVQAYRQMEQLCKPYATVIEIDREQLPSPALVNSWTPQQYVDALHHDQNCEAYNPSLRQLLHISFKIAAKMGDRFLDAIRSNEEIIGRGVTANLFERHIRPVFL
jgi:tagaturonate epimerase